MTRPSRTHAAAPAAPAGAAAPYTQVRFLVSGRKSMTVATTDPATNVTTRQQVAAVSLVPVDDAGNPLTDNVGGFVAGLGGALPGEFQGRIPSLNAFTIPDGAIVTLAAV